MELQISHRVCAKVPKEGILQSKKGGNRKNSETVVRVERGKNHRGRSLPGSHTHAGRDTAEAGSGKLHGIPEGKEQHNAIRTVWRTEVQIPKQRVLVQGVLCRYDRKKHKPDTGVHTKSVKRR